MSGVTISRRAVAMWQCLCPFPCWKSRGYRADGVLLKSSAKVHEDLCLSETWSLCLSETFEGAKRKRPAVDWQGIFVVTKRGGRDSNPQPPA
jgi:hypothetical protein